MNSSPITNKTRSRGGIYAALGSAAGYLALYFGIRFAVTVTVTLLYMLPALAASGFDASAYYTEALTVGLGRISFTEIICSTFAFFAAVYIVGAICDRKKPLAESRGLLCNHLRDIGFVGFPAAMLPCLLLLGLFLNIFISTLLDILPIPEEVLRDYADQSSMLDETSLISVLSTAVFAPLSEELVFRGLMISRLRRGSPTWTAVLISAAIFGLIHGQLLWICYAFLLGILLGAVSVRAHSTLAGILLHAAFNSASFLLPLFPELPSAVYCAISGLAAALLLAIIWLIGGRNAASAENSEVVQ